MPYYRFLQDDIFYNQIEARPKSVFYIYSGSIFYNNMPPQRGTKGNIWAEDNQNSAVPSVPNGNISLYEMNVDRDANQHTWNYALGTVANEALGNKKAIIHPFMTKAGGLQTFKTMTTGTMNTLNYGDFLTASFSYPLSASIQREYYSLNQSRFVDHQEKEGQLEKGARQYSHIDALKTTFDHYKILSQHYAYSASNPPGCDKSIQELSLISIPSMFYGSSIKKGTVDLRFYISGTLAARCLDKYKNGELIEVTGSQTGSVAGVVLYNEGFICLTGSWDLTNRTATNTTDPKVPSVPGTNEPAYPLSPHTEKYSPGYTAAAPKWTYFGTGIERSGSGPKVNSEGVTQTGYGIFATGSLPHFHLPSSSFSLEFQGVNYVPVITMLAHAPIAELNHSNNPTFVQSNASKPDSAKLHNTKIDIKHSGSNMPVLSGSKVYSQDKYIPIKNIVSSSYANHTASFSKQTYISKIGIYDENRNLIGVAKLATPVKKTEERDLTFKLKLDL